MIILLQKKNFGPNVIYYVFILLLLLLLKILKYYVKAGNNNNNNNAVLVARGVWKAWFQQSTSTHSGAGEKKTLNINVVGENKKQNVQKW